MRYDGPNWVPVTDGSRVAWDAPEFADVRRFAGSKFTTVHTGTVTHGGPNQYSPAIRTLEGVMRISRGDWVIKGTRGEVYPCKPGPFADTFEEIEGGGPHEFDLSATALSADATPTASADVGPETSRGWRNRHTLGVRW